MKLAQAGATFIALALSILSLWRQRAKVRMGLLVDHVGTAGDMHFFEVTVTNTGNCPFSIKQAHLADCKRSNDISAVLFESSKNNPALFLQPGNMVFISGSCSGSIQDPRIISVKVNNGLVFQKEFLLNQKYAQNWVAFLLTVFRRHLPEYDVFYSERIIYGDICRSYVFYVKGTSKGVGGIRGHNPGKKGSSRCVKAFEVEGTITDADDIAEDRLLRLIAERFPDLFIIDWDNSEKIEPMRGDTNIVYVLQYTEAASESYASDSGGSEYFAKYGFDPKGIVPPYRLV